MGSAGTVRSRKKVYYNDQSVYWNVNAETGRWAQEHSGYKVEITNLCNNLHIGLGRNNGHEIPVNDFDSSKKKMRIVTAVEKMAGFKIT